MFRTVVIKNPTQRGKLGDDTLQFVEDNKYLKTIKSYGENIGQKLGSNGFTFIFADPVNDPMEIGSGSEKINELVKLTF